MSGPGFAVVLLAAGGSTRLGTPKQLIDVDGEPLVCRVARELIAAAIGPVGVVVGGAGAAVRTAIRGLSLDVIDNDAWPHGIGTSIRVGVAWALDRDATGAVICLCDQPAIDGTHVRALAAACTDGVDVAATGYDDAADHRGAAGPTLGVPAAFARRVLSRLLALPDDRGAKSIFTDPTLRVARIRCVAAMIDLDTPEDVRRWRLNASD